MKRPGAYILLFRLQYDECVEVGRLGLLSLERGDYAYAGSAMNGLDARVARHLRAEKRRHWHIDYVLERATITRVLEFENSRRIECELNDRVRSLPESVTPVPGFGSSDCRCRSHLHYFGGREGAAEEACAEIRAAAAS